MNKLKSFLLLLGLLFVSCNSPSPSELSDPEKMEDVFEGKEVEETEERTPEEDLAFKERYDLKQILERIGYEADLEAYLIGLEENSRAGFYADFYRFVEDERFEYHFLSTNVEGEVVPETLYLKDKSTGIFYHPKLSVWNAAYDPGSDMLFLATRYLITPVNGYPFGHRGEELEAYLGLENSVLSNHFWPANNMSGSPTFTILDRIDLSTGSPDQADILETKLFGGEEILTRGGQLIYSEYTDAKEHITAYDSLVYDCWTEFRFTNLEGCDALEIPVHVIDPNTLEEADHYLINEIGELEDIREEAVWVDPLEGLYAEAVLNLIFNHE